MASSHALQPRQIKSNDRLLSIDNHGHSRLPRAAHDLPRRLLILGDIALSKLHALLAKELLRSVAPGSSGCAVNDDRVCIDGHVVYRRNAPMPPPVSSRRWAGSLWTTSTLPDIAKVRSIALSNTSTTGSIRLPQAGQELGRPVVKRPQLGHSLPSARAP